MRLHLALQALLRLWMGCQSWSVWQSGNPACVSIPSATFAHDRPKRKKQRTIDNVEKSRNQVSPIYSC